jgi:hypothetical protein
MVLLVAVSIRARSPHLTVKQEKSPTFGRFTLFVKPFELAIGRSQLRR